MHSARAVLLKTLLFMCLYSQLDASMNPAYTTGPPGDFLTLLNIAATSGTMDANLAYAIFKKVSYAVDNEDAATFAADVTKASPVLKDVDIDGLFTPLVYDTLLKIAADGTNTAVIKTDISDGKNNGTVRTGFDQTYDKLLAAQKKAAASTDAISYADAKNILNLLARATRIFSQYPPFKHLIKLGQKQFDGLPGVPAQTLATAYDNIATVGENFSAARKYVLGSLEVLKKSSLQTNFYDDLNDAFTNAQKAGTLSFQDAIDILNKIIAAASGSDNELFVKTLTDGKTDLSNIPGTPSLTLLDFINQILTARNANSDADLESLLADFLKTLKSRADATQSYTNLANSLTIISQEKSISLPSAVNLLTFLGQAASGKDYTMFSKALSDGAPKLVGVTGIPAVFMREVFANLTALGNDFPAITDSISTYQQTLTSYQMGIVHDYLTFIASVAADADPDISQYIDSVFGPILGNIGGTSATSKSNTGA